MLKAAWWSVGLTVARHVPIGAPSPQVHSRRLWAVDNAQLCVEWQEPGLGASRFRFNPWLALWPRICCLASLSSNFLILKKMMRPGSGVCCEDSRSCLKVCSMVPGEWLAAVIICCCRQRLSRVHYRRRSQKSQAWASIPLLAGFCRLVFILHRESRKSVVSSEFPALLSFVSLNCRKGLKETTSAFECPQG